MKRLLCSFILLWFIIIQPPQAMAQTQFYKPLQSYAASLPGEFSQIDPERQEALRAIGDYIVEKRKADLPVQITVICTHNSRRSHMGQLWLQAAAAYYGVPKVHTFSGGTEATAFNPRAVAALERAGFKINKTNNASEPSNPLYETSLGQGLENYLLFSKKFSHPQNPQKEFAAIMVCSDADAACPIVPGADGRFAIPYEDPKLFDGSPSETPQYDARARQIAREMFFVMEYAKNQIAVWQAGQK